jgi:phosphoenolpyruvate carboxylase
MAGNLELQREMYERWPFFAALISTLETALAGIDLGIGERYFDLADGAEAARRVWRMILAEHQRCEGRVLAIASRDRLLAPTSAALERHRWRRTWLDALSFLQLELLRRHRAADEDALAPLLATVAGVATGLRTTG